MMHCTQFVWIGKQNLGLFYEEEQSAVYKLCSAMETILVVVNDKLAQIRNLLDRSIKIDFKGII